MIKYLLPSLLLGFAFLPSQAQPAKDAPIVVVVTMDGFPARALKDPQLPMPTLRALIAKGAVAEGMTPINPSVTWPNHTTLITGVNASQHFVMANGLITFPTDGSAPKVMPWVDKDQLVHARTLYDAAAEKGMTTGQVDWVAVYGAKNVKWVFGEKPDVNDAIPQELIANGTVTRDQVEHFAEHATPAWHDEIWTDAAVDILTKHTPSLLLFHLLQTDSIQHLYAPLTPAAYEAYAYADSCLSRLVEAARAAGLLDRITFFIVADHGFATTTHTLYPNTALAQQGYLHESDSGYTGDVWVNSEGGAAELYIRDKAKRAELEPKLKAYFASQEGIDRVYTNEEARAIGIPSDEKTDQAPQLYLTAKPDYAFEGKVGTDLVETHGPRGQHGFLNTMPDMQTLFVASGAGIKPGVKLGEITNLRVAPTIAKVLGVSLPDAKEKPLDEILVH